MNRKNNPPENPAQMPTNCKPAISDACAADQDLAIYEILMNVLKRRQSGVSIVQATPVSPRTEYCGDELEETRIIAAPGRKENAPGLSSGPAGDDIPETVITSSATRKNKPLILPTASRSDDSSGLEETTIIQNRGAAKPLLHAAGNAPEPDFLTETVILQSRKKKGSGNDGR